MCQYIMQKAYWDLRYFYIVCLFVVRPSFIKRDLARDSPKRISAKSIYRWWNRTWTIIYFILETHRFAIECREYRACHAVDPIADFGCIFSFASADGGVKSISRSRHDKKRICMPAICNPSAGCRENRWHRLVSTARK